MNVVVTLEARFARTPDGAVLTRAPYAYADLRHYLDVFSHVKIVARVRDATTLAGDWLRSDGPGIAFAPLPDYHGPAQYVQRARRIRGLVARAVRPVDALILHVPSQLATSTVAAAVRDGRPFGVRVIGDPYDVFAPGVVDHPLRRGFRWWFVRQQRRQCLAACAVAYVTERALQRRYPPAPSAFATHFAIGILRDEDFVAARPLAPRTAPLRLITVGSLEQLYKGTDVLLDALALCRLPPARDLHLTILGDGRYRPFLESRARALGIADRVEFAGEVPAGRAVRDRLLAAHVFVLPSRTEGLPRALIEAMACAMPCIGSTAGGIPELLEPDDLVPPGDVRALADTLRALSGDPDRMARVAIRNAERARAFHERAISERRTAFYRHVKDRTARWAREHA